jgi:hypothetical protein
VAVALLLCAGLVTVAVASGHVFAFDDGLLLALRRTSDLQHPVGPHWFVNAFENFTSLGSSAVTGLVLVIAVIAASATQNYRLGRYLVLNFAGAELLSNGIKFLIARPRPEVVPHLVEAGEVQFSKWSLDALCSGLSRDRTDDRFAPAARTKAALDAFRYGNSNSSCRFFKIVLGRPLPHRRTGRMAYRWSVRGLLLDRTDWHGSRKWLCGPLELLKIQARL